MAIVRHLVELHGGTVRAASAGENQGATFTLVFPAQVSAPLSAEFGPSGQGSSAREPIDTTQRLDGVSIMVVDDDGDSRSFMCQLLEDRGASVVSAESTSDALTSFTQARPDVLVSDIGMPDEDGYTLIRRVRELPEGEGGGIPAIALTAYVRPEDARAAIVAGYQRHLSKPVAVTDLVATIAELAAASVRAD
jgi:CheY-like chemotaxis protein